MDHLTALRIFQKIVETHSFSKTSAQLNIPRSTVSKSLMDLEEYLNTKLINRTTRSVSTTLEGMEYYKKISHILTELTSADEQLKGMGQLAQGRVRVDIYSSLANFILIPNINDFQTQFPKIQLSLGISDRPVNLIEEGIDCVIRAGELNDSTLIAKTIYKDRLITCASPEYINRYGIPTSPEDLEQNHQIIGYISAVDDAIWPLRFNLPHGKYQISRFNIASNDSTGHIGLILNGVGIGQTHESMIYSFLENGSLIPILEAQTNDSIPISALFPPTKRLNTRTRLFLNWITEYLIHYKTKSIQ